MKKIIILCSLIVLSIASVFAQLRIMNKSEYSPLDVNKEFYSWETEYVDYYLAMVSGKSLFVDNTLIGKFSEDGQYFIFNGDDTIFIFNSDYTEGSIARGISARYEGTGFSKVDFDQVKLIGGIITQNSTRKLFTFYKMEPKNEPTPQRVVYSWYDSLPVITTKTWDENPVRVTAMVVLGYDKNNEDASQIITDNRFEIQDYIRGYFSGKKRTDITPATEASLKAEIKDGINNIIGNDIIKDVRFLSLEIGE